MKRIIFNATILTNAFLVFCGTTLVMAPAIADVHNSPLPPAYLARIRDFNAEYGSAKANLQVGNYAQAEKGFRAAIADDWGDSPYIGLAETLVAEGRITEALQTYYTYFHPAVGPFQEGSTADPKVNLEYALLLNQTGQWAEAVERYNAALPDLVKWDYKASIQFDPNTPQPAALAAAAHIGLGLYDNIIEFSEPGGNVKALQEYNAALQLAPDWDAANYYYGYGWEHLAPKERAKFGTAQQAKAALQKAVKIGNAGVKKAAQKALKDAG